MKPGRLSSELLARKGKAAPLAGAYGGTGLEPLIGLFGRGAGRPCAMRAPQRPEPAEISRVLGVETRPLPTVPDSRPFGDPTAHVKADDGVAGSGSERADAAPPAGPSKSIPADGAGPILPPRRNAPTRLSLHLDAERHMRLRIVAARKGTRPQELLRHALDSVLAAATDECPCVRGELPCCRES